VSLYGVNKMIMYVSESSFSGVMFTVSRLVRINQVVRCKVLVVVVVDLC